MLAELRWAVRSQRGTYNSSFLAALLIAIGMGANLAAFAMFDRILFTPLPYAEPDRLAHAYLTIQPLRTGPAANLPYEVVRALEEREDLFDGIAWAEGLTLPIPPVPGEPPLLLTPLTPNALSVLGVRPIAGRAFDESDVSLAEKPVVLSHETWQQRYGSSPGVLSSSWRYGEVTFRVLGVLPKGFLLPTSRLLDRFDGVFGHIDELLVKDPSRAFIIAPFLRLRPGVSVKTAQIAVDTLMISRDWAIPALRDDISSHRLRVTVQPLRSGMSLLLGPYPWLVSGTVWAVLLIATLNLSLMLLARSHARQHDNAVRTVHGASFASLMRLTTLEAAVIVSFGAILGLVAYTLMQSLLTNLAPAQFRTFARATFDTRVIVVAIVLPIGSTLLASVVPAVVSCRVDPLTLLRQGTETYTHGMRMVKTFLGSQAALGVITVLMAIGALWPLVTALTAKRGFNSVDLYLIRFSHGSSGPGYGDARRWERVQAIQEVMSTTPGVVAAGVAFRAPFDDQPSENAFWAAQRRRGSVLGVGAGIFAALQTQVLAGREFSSQEISSNSMVAMLNVSGVRALWPSGTISEALGRDVPTTSGARRLIGIVEDIARDTSSAVTPTLFLPITASEVRAASRSLTVLVRMQPGHGPDRTPIDRLLYERLGPGSVDLESMVSRRAVQLERPRFVALVFGVLAFFSVLMVAVATFALGHLHATRLGREAAIRVAVGMAPARLRLWVLAQGLMPTLFGTVIGLGCSWILFRLAPGHLLGVNPPRWSGYMISALTFALLMFPVSWLSSRRLFTGAPVDLLRAP